MLSSSGLNARGREEEKEEKEMKEEVEKEEEKQIGKSSSKMLLKLSELYCQLPNTDCFFMSCYD